MYYFCPMLSKQRIKLIHSLAHKKYRTAESLFVVEGTKLVGELLQEHAPFRPHYVATTNPAFQAAHPTHCIDLITKEELHKASFLQHPQESIALFHLPTTTIPPTALSQLPANDLCLALDGIQDPGNLGTIIRTCDWYGIRHIFCSPDCADVYAPKAVQATMGSLARVQLHYGALETLLTQAHQYPVYGTFLEGTPLSQITPKSHGLLIMGNEGKGISPTVSEFITQRIFVPPYPADRPAAERPESLNVAICTAILCATFRQ